MPEVVRHEIGSFHENQVNFKFVKGVWEPNKKRIAQMKDDIYTKSLTELIELENK